MRKVTDILGVSSNQLYYWEAGRLQLMKLDRHTKAIRKLGGVVDPRG